MELSVQEQIFDLLGKANKILIALPEVLTADSLASGLGLKLFLQKLHKDVDLASSGTVPENLKFLPGADSVKSMLAGGQSLVITVDASKKKIEEISYQTALDKAYIYLKSQGEVFSADDLSFAADNLPLDAIITLDTPALETLGALFESHADLFYQTPKINIDHKAGNEYFGAINLIDLASSSVAEILCGLLERFEPKLLNEDIATCLLAGIITKTHSFQEALTTPEAFLKAARLVNLGARQQEIIRHIYKTKSLPLLKLWGRLLARLTALEELSLIYSVLQAADFEKSQAGGSELVPALKELLENVSGFKLAAVFAQQQPGGVRLVLAAHLSLPAGALLNDLGASNKPALELWQFKVYEIQLAGVSLAEAEQRLLGAARKLNIGRQLIN